MIPESATVSPGSSNAQSRAPSQHTESAPTFNLLLLPLPQEILLEADGSSKNTPLGSGDNKEPWRTTKAKAERWVE